MESMICNKILLREWELFDKASLAYFANNKKIFDNLRDGFPYPYTIEHAEKFIENARLINLDTHIFAIDYNGNAIGSIGYFLKKDVYRKNAEIGYWLGEEYWGRGIMTYAIDWIVRYIFNNCDVVRIFAEPYAHNTGSRKVLEKTGFKCEAVLEKNVFKNNELIDSCIYSLLR